MTASGLRSRPRLASVHCSRASCLHSTHGCCRVDGMCREADSNGTGPGCNPPAGSRGCPARSEQDRKIARLELALLEKNAQVEELQADLDQAREEVVRAMAKLQTLASRAEAASGMAEAEVALQPLKGRTPQQTAPEAAQATKLLREASVEFNQENYGGALYLANQAKALAAAGTGRLSSREHSADRPGEMPFAVPSRSRR